MSAARRVAAPCGQPAERREDWAREQLSLRLTPKRRERLRSIASAMADDATPSEAVDRAIELALARLQAGPTGLSDPAASALTRRFDALDEAMDCAARDRAADSRELGARVGEALAEVRSIAALLSGALADTEAPADHQPPGRGQVERGPGDALPLRSWLDALSAHGGSVDAVGRWLTKSRLAGRLAEMEFEIARSGGGAVARVRLGPIAVDSPLTRAEAEESLRFACRRHSGGGWVFAIHAAADAGADGTLIWEARV